MKRLLESRLASAVLLAALGIALGLAPRTPPAPTIPPLDIAGLDASSLLPGHTRQEVHAAWGEPDGTLSGFFGDIYTLDKYTSMIIYYDPRPLNDGTADENTVPVLNIVYGEV